MKENLEGIDNDLFSEIEESDVERLTGAGATISGSGKVTGGGPSGTDWEVDTNIDFN